MNFFRRLFSPKPTASQNPSAASPDTPPVAPRDDQPIIVHDAYGREVQLTKEQWRDTVLLAHLEKVRDQPEALAAAITQSLHDGFAAEVLASAAHLAATDPQPERGHVLHAATLLELKRPAEAEQLLRAFAGKHGETGLSLAHLARAEAEQGHRERALDTLWRALSLDPNQDTALAWYAAHQRELHGPEAALEAYRRVAELPDSWRARLALARHALEQRDLAAARQLYDEALDRAPRPVPADLLQQMSGDLGNHGHLPEILQLAAPYYDIAKHGLPTGSNLLKTYHDLGQLDAARRLLDRLYAQNRPDWKTQLAFWETELAKTRIATTEAPPPGKVEVTLLSVEGPVWLPPDSPAAELFPAKSDDALLVAFLGSSAELPPPPADPAERNRLADGPGRLSRALPLYLAEQVEFATPALARVLVPWVVKPSPGYILGGMPWDDATAARHARAAVPDDAADYLFVTHLRCLGEPWSVELRLVRTIDGACLATASVPCPPADPGQCLPELTRVILELLATHAESPASTEPQPAGLALPAALHSHYLLRLEQLLAVRTAGIEPAKSTLNHEREILEGQLRLCLDRPDHLPSRLLLAHTLRAMKRVRPEVVPEFRPRIDLLQSEHPLPEPAQAVVARVFAAAFTA